MTTNQTMPNNVDGKVIERIQKLLTLAEHETSNVSEAGNAAAKVQELLDIHNLGMAQVLAHNTDDVDDGIVELDIVYGPFTSALNKAWQQLMGTIGDQYNCIIINGSKFVLASEAEKKKSRQVRQLGYKKVAVLMIIGTQDNADTSVTLFTWLRNRLEIEATKEWPLYRDEMKARRRDPGDPIPFRVNFIMGASNEIGAIMRERRESRENYEAVTALAVNYEKANQKFIDENYEITGQATGTKSQMNGYAYNRGKEAGRRVERSREGSLTPGSPTTALPRA